MTTMNEPTSREKFIARPPQGAPPFNQPPAPSAERQRTAEEINQRIERVRKGESR